MSLWRVKHTLSPAAETAVVLLAVIYGLFGIWMASLRPFAVAVLSPSGNAAEPIALDVDAWTRHDVVGAGYVFAAPPEWIVDAMDPASIRLGRDARRLRDAPHEGDGILIEAIALGGEGAIARMAAAEFAGRRPALYDVAVDGAPALFAVEFSRGRVARQVVYVPQGDRTLAIRSASLDPAAFAAFVSTIKLF